MVGVVVVLLEVVLYVCEIIVVGVCFLVVGYMVWFEDVVLLYVCDKVVFIIEEW